MGIKSPTTYGDYFWAKQVEATAQFDEDIESAFAPYFSGVLAELPYLDEVPPRLRGFIKALAEPPSSGFGGFALGVGVEMVDETLRSLMSPSIKVLSRVINRGAMETWLTSEQANTLFMRGKIEHDLWSLSTASEGYEDILAKFLYKAQKPYPSIPELILWARYHGDPDNPFTAVQEFFDIDADDFPVWNWLGKQRLTTLQAQTLFRRGLISSGELTGILARIGWHSDDRGLVQELGWVIPNAMLLVQGDLQQQKTQELILQDISRADINPVYAKQYLDAILTKPSSQDLIAYELRKDPALTGLPARLQQIGIHPDYIDVYKTLAYPIPPVADIITMAVREAFTPEIAARFGQYQDYPPAFEEWALKKGLSKDWSQRYWAAHWSLPSAAQGFQMLHRGVIDSGELNMLLRALDVMPFWRDRLTRIAYKRLTRVDIRRMYRVGVLTEAEVFEAYQELGYNDRDARRMSEFTVKQTLATQSKFTARDIISAYTKYVINRSEARSLLREVGVKEENLSFIISTADYKRDWELTESRIEAIHNLYRQCTYDSDAARAKLLALNLPAERVNVLMERWYLDAKDRPSKLWTTAQTLGFIAAGLISIARGRKELIDLGYDDEHINLYLKAN